jgi:UDP-glucose 4-epimerase
MRALITGASGLIGFELVKQLHRRGTAVSAAVGPQDTERESRRVRELEQLKIPIIPCELRRERPLERVPTDWDVLFHLAAYVRTEEDSADVHINDHGTQRLLDQLPLAQKRVVYTSTLAVADNALGGKITSATRCTPRTAYGRTKLAAEGIVRSTCQLQGATNTTIRMPTTYGRGFRPHGIFDVLPERLARQELLARIAWPGRLALLSVEDAAELLWRSAEVPETRGRVFLASSNENPMTWEIAAAIAQARGIPYRPLPLPKPFAALLRAALGRWWQTSAIPHALQITAWRAGLLLNGLYCEGAELTQMLGLTYRPWREGFAEMYG